MSEAPKLYASTKEMADLLKEKYPGIEVVITEPLPMVEEI